MKWYQTLFTVLVLVQTPLLYAEPLTKASAAQQVKSQSGGKVLSVDEKQRHGQTLYRVKVLHEDGKVKIYQLDATTGKSID